MICCECGNDSPQEVCQSCMDGAGTMSLDLARQCDMSLSCGACQRMISTNSRQCSSCQKHYHFACDSSANSQLNGFVCMSCCRRSQSTNEDVMLSASAEPSRSHNAPLSPFGDSSVSHMAMQMSIGAMTANFSSSSTNDFGAEMYSQMTTASMFNQQSQHQVQQMLATQSQLMDEISDGGATNDSDRNSSPFYQESSDYDEDFVPMSSRGRGRGGGKKKPGRGQSSGSRRQTNAGPTGFFSATQFQAFGDFQQPPPTRGKRGKRGNGTTAPRASGKGPGRGRGRGRGSSAQLTAALQQMQFASNAPIGFPMYPPGNSQMLHMNMSSVGLQMMAPSSMLQGTSNSINHPLIPPVPLLSNIENQPIPSTPVPPAADDSTQDPVGGESQDFGKENIDAIREVDETFLEDEDSRHSGTSRTDEVEYTKIPVVCRANDEFLQKACLCLVCGSIGKGPEASMVACSNCAQTYHTYCITLATKKLQLNSAVLNRGWRCLDCTICEGCGNGTDEEKLLLCDECDVSYHVYCMKPPLEKVPEGPWRCQWCSRCRRCKQKTSGNELNAKGLCGSCASLQICPRCNRSYHPSEKIIRCSQCSKWQHGACENLHTDEQLEQAAMNRMRCSACRPSRTQAHGLSDADTIIVDNVALSKDAHEILKSKYNPSALKSHMLEASYRDSFDHYEEDFSALDDPSEPSTSQPALIGQRGRGRGNPSGRRGMNRIGVGGFYAKLPRHRIQALSDEAAAAALAEEEDSKKTKRPRKPRRSQLEDAYPSQIQEAFFGIKAVEGKTLVDVTAEEPVLPEFGAAYSKPKVVNNHFLSKDATDMLRNDINENELLEGLDINMDADLDFDFSLLIDDEAEYNEELEDSLQGDNSVKEELPEGSYGPTTFNLEQRPSISNGISGSFGQQAASMPGMNPANFAQQAPGVRMAVARSGSQSDAPDRYQFSARWEEDEPAGLMATTAAVLYSNEKHPYLKQQFPNWTDRVKQIQKLWRNLSSDERQEYVNRARDNRTKHGSKPRPRRVNVNSTNSVDSPTTQSPAVGMSEFKVPMNPGAPTTSTSFGAPSEPQPLKKVHVTNHLSQEHYHQWQEMKRVRIDRERLIASLEEQLVKARKQKKNLAAKRRQMQRVQQAAPDYDGRQVDLSDNDQQLLQQLTDQIKATQAEIDNSRRDLNTRKAAMAEFEQSHRILRNEGDVSAFDMEQSAARDNQYAAQVEHRLAQQAQAQGLGMVAAPQMAGPQPSIHLPMLHQQQMMQMQGMPMRAGPGFMIRQPGGLQMTMQQQHQQEMHRRMMQQMRPRPAMGSVRLDQMTDPVMRDVYMCLDAMISDVHTMLETPKEAQHALRGPPPQHILQRIMPNGGPPGPPGPRLIMPGHIPQGPIPQLGPINQLPPPPPTPQSAQPPLLPDDEPKPKKKRASQKKATSTYSTSGQYETWLETMRTRFRLCPEVPKCQKEPKLGRPSCEFLKHRMMDTSLLRKQKPLIGEFGAMTVKRGTRLFGSDDRTEKAITFNDVNIYQVDPPIRLVALYNTPKPEADDDVIQDEMDAKICLNPNSVISRLSNKKLPPREHIRCLARYMEEPKAPVCPEVSMFTKPRQVAEDEIIELVFNTSDLKQECTEEEKNELSAKHLQQLKEIISIKEEIEWKMEDTPPDSPVCSSPEPEALDGIRQTTSTSRAPSASVEKEIKREEDEDVPASSILREIKKELFDSSQPQECKQCHKIIDDATSAVRVTMAKLGILNQEATSEEKDEMVSFCSKKCYYETMSTGKSALTHEELAEAEQFVSEEIVNKLKQNLTESIVKAVNQGKKPAMSSFSTSSLLSNADILVSPRDTRYMMDEGKKDCVIIVPVSTLIGSKDANNDTGDPNDGAGDDWKAYTSDIFESFVNIHQQHQQCILAPKIGVPHPPYELDTRICIFCGGVGDGETSLCGRLIALTEYYWVHVNCALWSSEVFEHEMGILSNVERAVIRAAQTPCDHCKRPGASVKCHKMNCGTNYHVTCARNHNGYFVKDRTFICKAHDKVQHQVYRLDALRKIFIKRDENKMLMSLFELTDGPNLCLKLGAFTFYKLGSINPTQLKKFHNKDYIFPHKYRVTRFFWSPRNVRERMLFECSIEDRNNQPVFVVKSLEDPTIAYRASSATKAWSQIFDKISKLREIQTEETLRFFGSQITGESLFGLSESTITKITESLPGFDTVFTYQNRHQNSPVLELPLAENPMGCARAEPRSRTVGQHFRNKPQPMGGCNQRHHGVLIVTPTQSTQATIAASSIQLETLQSRQASTSVTSANSGRTRGVRSYYTEEAAARARAFGISPDLASISLRMETSQSSQTAFSAYQKMRREWKERVYLARSRIAGLGLYAKNDISMGEFIIEYKGEIIRSEVCEVREIRYTAHNRGVYMFRIDEEWVIDATMAGGPARYINHSCDPNCSTQILDAGSGSREKKIIITANRPISSNEELTYDYQFELEGTTDKIPCLCGAPNCVKWMN